MTPRKDPRLLSPLTLGGGEDAISLSHRVVLAPLTRNRSPNHVPNELVAEYYGQRTTAGGLLVTEGVHPSVLAGNYHSVPGIYNDEQVKAWKNVTSVVHRKRGIIFLQLWHVGRLTHSSQTSSPPKAASIFTERYSFPEYAGLPRDTTLEQPEEMTIGDIHQAIAAFVHAAKRAIEADFDGIELHAGSGYLLDQFLKDNSNHRTDDYGGSIENRARLLLETLDAVIAAVGRARVGIRMSPLLFFNGAPGSDPIRQFQLVAKEVEKRGIAYMAIVEPNLPILDADLGEDDAVKLGSSTISEEQQTTREYWSRLQRHTLDSGVKKEDLRDYLSLASFRRFLKKTPVLGVGGYNRETALTAVEEGRIDGVCFGRWFISNPDLVERIRMGREFSHYDRTTFYTCGSEGYTDYKPWKAVSPDN